MGTNRRLSFKALLYMDGMKVIVKDLFNDIYDQECTVNIIKEFYTTNKNKKESYVKQIVLENEEYKFVYDWRGNCVDGEFEVYSCS